MEENNPVEITPRKKSIFTPFIPTPEYFITPILININVLIWLAMVLTGVDALFPTSTDLLRWGANMRSLTMGGEWWRLVSSIFLHYGILHLFTNMFALYSIGQALEPFTGKSRFLILYICAGLGGNAVSLWWHDAAAGAGASGAIFGTFGIFAALLTTDLIDKNVRKGILKSLVTAISINLLIGLHGMIDNSAHIGGLLTGIICGYLSYFDLKAWYFRRKKQNTFLLACIAFTAGTLIFFWQITPPAVNLESLNEELFSEMKIADQSREQNSSASAETIRREQIEHWEKSISISETMLKSRDLTPKGKKIITLLNDYAEYRMTAAQYHYRALTENNPAFSDSSAAWNQKADETGEVIFQIQK